MLCHCKVACTNNTISLMFGCKVGRELCMFVFVSTAELEGHTGEVMDCGRETLTLKVYRQLITNIFLLIPDTANVSS